jgi:hypothetical protein
MIKVVERKMSGLNKNVNLMVVKVELGVDYV